MHTRLVAVESLLEQNLVGKPRGETALDDLFPGLFRLSFGLGDLEERLALLLRSGRVDIVARQPQGLRERDV